MFIVIARLDEESEIDAILSGGVSFERIVAPLVFAGLVLGVVSLLLVGYLQPYSRFGYRALLNAATDAGWTARLDPQVFINAGPDFTISADEADPTGRRLKGVFIRRKTAGRRDGGHRHRRRAQPQTRQEDHRAAARRRHDPGRRDAGPSAAAAVRRLHRSRDRGGLGSVASTRRRRGRADPPRAAQRKPPAGRPHSEARASGRTLRPADALPGHTAAAVHGLAPRAGGEARPAGAGDDHWGDRPGRLPPRHHSGEGLRGRGPPRPPGSHGRALRHPGGHHRLAVPVQPATAGRDADLGVRHAAGGVAGTSHQARPLASKGERHGQPVRPISRV